MIINFSRKLFLECIYVEALSIKKNKGNSDLAGKTDKNVQTGS